MRQCGCEALRERVPDEFHTEYEVCQGEAVLDASDLRFCCQSAVERGMEECTLLVFGPTGSDGRSELRASLQLVHGRLSTSTNDPVVA
jgi:hypothetical protein